MVATVFIDGEVGTTGLQIRQRLSDRRDLKVVAIDPAERKLTDARRRHLNAADVAILCLPDDAAREAVGLIDNPDTRVIDASTAHRTSSGWTFGFPEMAVGQREAIVGAKRVSNPGCWSTAFIALVRPLVEAGLIPRDWPLTVHGVSGYSGGGKAMIAEFEAAPGEGPAAPPFRAYGLAMGHKHLPEMRQYTGLAHIPVFSPAVGRYFKGMAVEAPLPLYALPARPRLADIHEALVGAYGECGFVEVAPLAQSAEIRAIEPESLNGTNRMRLYVFGTDDPGQARLIAVLDNLGKGASGAAVQNLNLMLGLPEGAGL
jgi:N-acetyl-gamma-glutamyl-phosphate reductase